MAETPHAGPDQHKPDWEQFPNLDGVITEKDLDTKGEQNSKYSPKYVNWCKTAAKLREHAPGWQFELRSYITPEGLPSYVWKAPDGTGYVVGYFRAPKGSPHHDSTDFPQAIMEARPVFNEDGSPKLNKWNKQIMDPNASIPWDEITARDITDTHRRCLCTAAAAFFGLGYELWAKVDLENPMREEAGTQKRQTQAVKRQEAPVKRSSAKSQNNQPTQANESDLTNRIKEELGPEFDKHKKGDKNPVLDEWKRQYKDAFKLTPDIEHISGSMIQTEEQFNWTKKFLEYNAVPQAK